MAFNLDDYEPVADRIEKFWTGNPQGRITTDLVHRDDKGFIVKAMIWRNGASDNEWSGPDSTGYAEEIIGSTNVNRTSALENCETSAIGRALANLGYAVKGQRASREEMAKVQPEPRQRSGMQRTPRNPPTATESTPTAPAPVQASNGTGPSQDAPDLELVRWVAKQKLALVDQLGGDKAKAKAIWAEVLSTYGLDPDQMPLKDSLQFIESDLSIAVGEALTLDMVQPGPAELVDAERPFV